MTKFGISVTYDVTCPWCFIGKRQLQAGIEAYRKAHPSANDTFDMTYHPFQLNPAAPKPGVNKEEYSLQRFGDPKRLHMMHARAIPIGEKLGIHFKEGGKTGNTRDAHRLINFAGTKGSAIQSKVLENLYSDFHENERDITDLTVLEDAGVRAGLSAEEAKAVLESNDRDAEVEKELQAARQQGITGVPNYVVQDAYELQGAQDADSFRHIFERIKSAEANA